MSIIQPQLRPIRKNLVTRFQTVHVVLNFLGSTFFILGGILCFPLLVAFLTGEISESHVVKAFIYPIFISFLAGVLLKLLFQGGPPNALQAMLICGLGWFGFSAIGGIPFVIGVKASYLNSFFEAMSGFTTTGTTMFTGLDEMPRTILFWRSFTQWLGGLGILTFFLVIVYRGGSAHRLFGAESHKTEMRRPVPGLFNTVKILWIIYTVFTLVIAGALFLAGMTPFDSTCHSFTALSTGGFSPHDASIAYYHVINHPHYRMIEYVLIVGMLLGGTNFLIHYRVLKGSIRALWDNTEMKYWWALIGIFVLVILLEMKIPFNSSQNPGLEILEETFRNTLFQVTSITTTTGFGTRDIGSPYFGQVARQLFLVMMVIGGCVGSTGGGLKVLRVAILGKLIRREVYRQKAPRQAITTILVDGKSVGADQIYRVSALFFMWIVLLIIGGVITASLSGLGGYESFSGMFSAVGNIGPSYILAEDMISLSPVVKIVYIFGMLAGRLEILPVLLLFSPGAWYTKMTRR
jgi:trk system potassium uptake protein TrkH